MPNDHRMENLEAAYQELMGKRVLVVEDDEEDARLLVHHLKQYPFEINVTSRAETALDWLEKKQFHLLLIDVRLPGMDGIAFIRLCHTRWPAMPVVIVTGYDSPETMSAAKDLKVLMVFKKPVERKQINNLLAQLNLIWKTTNGPSH